MTDQHVYGLIFLALLMAASYGIQRLKAVRATLVSAKDTLASVLLWWGENDAFTVRDLLNGGVAIFGRTGSGKTSSSGKALANAIVRYGNSGGLILAAKPEDRAMWEGIFAAAGRSDDLLVFSPDNPLRFNFLDYEMQAGGHTRNITKCITVIGETLRSSDTTAGENADFWQREQERLIFNAVEIVKLATGKVGAPELQKFISTAAMSPAQLKDEGWLAGFHNQCLKAAFQKHKSPTEQHDFDLAKEYFLGEFPSMADKTRSSIMTGVMGILHTFNTGVVRELVSTTTNVTPDDMFAGKWILIDMPPGGEWGDIGNFVCAGWKYLTQKAVLRRHAGEADSINVIWCDEAQQFVNSHDAIYLAQCRSHKGCMIFLTQSLASYYSALKGDTGKHQADALLTNFHHKVFHALGDVQTAEFASALVGKSLQNFIGGSTAPQDNMLDEMFGQSKFTGSFNQHYEKVLQDNVFMNGLRTGGHANGLLVDAIVIRSGEPFSNGQNWLWATFSQKGGGS